MQLDMLQAYQYSIQSLDVISSSAHYKIMRDLDSMIGNTNGMVCKTNMNLDNILMLEIEPKLSTRMPFEKARIL